MSKQCFRNVTFLKHFMFWTSRFWNISYFECHISETFQFSNLVLLEHSIFWTLHFWNISCLERYGFETFHLLNFIVFKHWTQPFCCARSHSIFLNVTFLKHFVFWMSHFWNISVFKLCPSETFSLLNFAFLKRFMF